MRLFLLFSSCIGLCVWRHYTVEMLVWGCNLWSNQCVVAVHTPDTTSVILHRVPPRQPRWCNTKSLQNIVEFPISTLGDSRTCTDFLYSCTRGNNVTLWYHHFHKAGGSTFVSLAKANGATLVPRNSNGNPLGSNGARIPFWTFTPTEQVIANPCSKLAELCSTAHSAMIPCLFHHAYCHHLRIC